MYTISRHLTNMNKGKTFSDNHESLRK